MSDQAPERGVRARHKEISRTLAGLLGGLALASAGFGVALLFGLDPAAPLWARFMPFGVSAFSALASVLRSVVRTTITGEAVEVEKGLASVRIPLAGIASASTEFKTPVRGAQLFMAGSRGVLVEWTDALGATHKALVGADEPGALAADIHAARSALRAQVRVRAPEEAGEADAEADAEAAVADADAASRRR